MSVAVDLRGKVALVTGASSGLGAHFASLLALSGAEVILVARRAEKLEAVVAGIRSSGGNARPAPVDVADAASVRALWAAIGAVDILINNAGVARSKPLLEEDEADWDYVVDTNARGAFLIATSAAREMISEGRKGSIVNIASILGLRQAKQVASYAVSKAALLQMTKVMALELARFGIRVNSLCPGYIATDFNQDFLESAAGKRLLERIPQQRFGSMDDLNGPLLLLASDASRFMTGSELVVDGGHVVSSL